MNLTDEDKKRIVDQIQEKCGSIKCFCCGSQKWALIDFATLPIGFDIHTTRFYYHQGIPQISLACSNCGHMMLFNAGILGLKPDQPQAYEIQDESGNGMKEAKSLGKKQ